MNKFLWVDTETTGLDPAKNTVHQVAGHIVIDGTLQESFNLQMAPAEGAVIEKKALAVSNLTEDDVKNRDMSSYDAYCVFNNLLCTYVDKYNREDKLILAGYNVGFDAQFLNTWYKRHGNKYFFGLCQGGAYFDVLQLVLFAEIKAGKRLFRPDRKLVTVAKTLGVDIKNAHDALADIDCTRAISFKLWEKVTR